MVPKRREEIAKITDEDISWEEIVTTLKALRNNKAESDDKIPVEFYKLVEKEKSPTSNLAKALFRTLQEVYNTG